jgi:hypothetical protein
MRARGGGSAFCLPRPRIEPESLCLHKRKIKARDRKAAAYILFDLGSAGNAIRWQSVATPE